LNYIIWDKGVGQGQLSEHFTKYPTATERCLFVCKGANNASSGCFRTKDYYFEGFESIRGYMCDELRKAGLSIRDAIEATSSYASHYFTKSQWAFPTEDDYNKIKSISNNKGFQKEYKELQKEYKELLPYFNNTHDNMNDVWHFKVTSKKERELCGNHATTKPIALCSRAIKSSSRENETVLDLFGGSGSTLIACEQLDRTCYMMELDPKYCDVIIARWEKLTNQKATKIN
jgi:DNA modification methylase